MWSTRNNRRSLSLTIGVGAALLGLTLSGCSSPANGADPSSSPGKSDAVVQQIKNRGTVNIGVCLTSPPYGLIKSDGKPDGFDVTIARKIAADLGVKLNVIDTNNASRIPELQTGKADAVVCTFTITPERQQQVDFTDPYMVTGRSLVVRKGSKIKTLADLSGKTVASTKGGISVQIINQANPNAKQQLYDNYSQEVLALEQGQADAMIEESNLVAQAVKQHPDLKTVIDGNVGDKSYFGVGVKKGQPGLLAEMNKVVHNFVQSGDAAKAFTKYFNAKPTFQFKNLDKKK